jgi:CRISPR-associated protein Csd1
MILQALKEYYDRKAADPDSGIAPEGWEPKGIPFVVSLSAEGMPLSLECTIEGAGKSRRPKTFLVPKAVIRTVAIAANCCWDNPEYVFGVVQKGKPERVVQQHAAFCQAVHDLGVPEDPGIASLMAFLARQDKIELLCGKFPDVWRELIDSPGANVGFRLAGDDVLIPGRPAVRQAIDRCRSSSDCKGGFCLVTGESGQPIETLHPVIKGVWGAQSTGANVVSFNLDAFKSFGHEQGANAPISKAVAFAYATALNRLLDRDSRQRLQVGDATVVFWAARDTVFEDQVSSFFVEPPKDDPDRQAEAVRALHESVRTGAYDASDQETRFYVLGISPNAKRLSVRFWHVGTVPEMAARFDRHFDDLSIVHGPKERDHLPLWRLLAATAAQGKSDNIPPNLAGDTMRSILAGLPYPRTLLQAAIRRIHAEHDVTYPRAAMIKACINRQSRYDDPTNQEELTMSLDEGNPNIGYRLGRLFAALERIQERASPGINATIRDRFYGAASGTPATVFGTLIRMSKHHLAKLENAGERVNLERLIGEIMSGIADFPPHLPLADQGRFAIGYYHQRQKFFEKKSDKTE